MMPHQNGQGNIGKQRIPINRQNPDAQRGYGLLERKLGTGDKTLLELAGQSLELAGQKPELVAPQVIQTLKDEVESFNGPELGELVGATTKAIQEIDLGPNANPTPIAREVLSIAMPFAEEAKQSLRIALEEMQRVSPDNPNSTQDPSKPPLSFLGPNTPSKQNPQGPVLAA